MLSVALTIGIAAAAYYVIVQRPHTKMRAEHEKFLHGIAPGDYVMTVGGIFGKLLELDARSAVLEIAPGNVIRVATDGISRRVEAAPPMPALATPAPEPPIRTTDDEVTTTVQQQPWPQQPSAQHTAPAPPAPAAASAGTQTSGALPAFVPTFSATVVQSPVAAPAQPEVDSVAAPTPGNATVQQPADRPGPSAPMPDPQDPRDEVTGGRPAGRKLRRRSQPPDGFGPTARKDDPHVASALEQAASERDGLADAWRRVTAPLLDEAAAHAPGSRSAAPVAVPGPHAAPTVAPMAASEPAGRVVFPSTPALPLVEPPLLDGLDVDTEESRARPFVRPAFLTGQPDQGQPAASSR